MLRLALILSLAFAPAVGVTTCASPCEADAAQGTCPASCSECAAACTHAPMFEVSSAVAVVPAVPGWTPIDGATFGAPQVDPRKVRHVPKA